MAPKDKAQGNMLFSLEERNIKDSKRWKLRNAKTASAKSGADETGVYISTLTTLNL